MFYFFLTLDLLCAPVQNCQYLTLNICSTRQTRSEAVNSHKVSIFLGDWEQLPGSHNRIPGGNLTPSALQTPTKTLRGSAEKETPPAACQPITASLPFDFPTPPLRLASAARRDTRPRVVIGGFSRLCGSHLNTPPFGSERSAAGSNIRGAETEWRPEQHRSTAERLDWLPYSSLVAFRKLRIVPDLLQLLLQPPKR